MSLSRRAALVGAGAAAIAAVVPSGAYEEAWPPRWLQIMVAEMQRLHPDAFERIGYEERDPVLAVAHMARDARAGVDADLVRREARRFAGHFR